MELYRFCAKSGLYIGMIDLELPLGKRTKKYRFFEMLPGILSYGAVILLFVLSYFSPLLAAIYLLLLIITMIVKAVGMAYHTIMGRQNLVRAQKIDWAMRLRDLEYPAASADRLASINNDNEFEFEFHKDNLRLAAADPKAFPKPSQLYNAVIIATYNESFEVLDTTLKSVVDSEYDSKHIILVIAYEERGGAKIKATVERLKVLYASNFKEFLLVKHPADLPDEVVGKGPNITYAAQHLQVWLDQNNISYNDVIVTTLDSDNRPHPTYFDYVTYEYIVHEDRKHLSYQPIALYFGNIWDAPAPMRVIATGNSFWTIISSMRPHSLRNFAAHSQPMEALVEMGFWSKRSIVEDGHQYWRSYFYFGGNYSVVPIYVPIYQDAVMANTLKATFITQFKQLRRWSYGASDVPYVAVRVLSKYRNVPLGNGLAHLVRLIDSHITLASVAILVAVGGWVPLLVNSEASRDIAAHQLPEVISGIQRVAMIGLFITIFISLKMLPARPARYKRRRTIGMVLQWLLMPITSVLYSSLAAYTAQTYLLFGKYLDKFDVTDKATIASVDRAKRAKGGHDDASQD